MKVLCSLVRALFLCLPSGYQIGDIPEPTRYASGHGRRRAKRAIDLNEVVSEVAESNRRRVICEFLGEGISKSSKSPNRHANRKVVALDITSADVLRVWGTGNCVALTPETNGGAITFLSIFRNAIHLHQLGVVDIIAKCLIDCLGVKLQTIAGELDAIRQSTREVLDEVSRGLRCSRSNHPAGHELGIGIDCGPQPRVTSAVVLLRDIRGDVLSLAVAERPAFIDLHPFAFQVAEHAVLVIGAERPNFHDQPNNGLFGDSRHADGRADRATLDQATDDLGALFRSEAVHTSIMLEPLTHVKTFEKFSKENFRRKRVWN